jgi:glutamate racemase
MVVIACNTVSAVALDVVQKRARVPVTGVIVPGAIAAARATVRKRVGIIGTIVTVQSNAYTNAIRSIDADIQVFAHPCPLFVPLAEEGWLDHPVTRLVAQEYLFPLRGEAIDTLILGCTHYPVLRDAIAKAVDPDVALIDSGEATAVEVERMLDAHGLRNPSTQQANLQFYVSDVPAKFTEVGERFLGRRMGRVHRVAGF